MELQEQKEEISIYTGKLDNSVIGSQMLKMGTAFPQLENEFFDILTERVVANGFSNKRLKDAVSYLIDNFKYPKPSIADIISFDKRIKIYSYSEYQSLILKREAKDEDFEKHFINEKLFFVKKSDCILYNFKPNSNK